MLVALAGWLNGRTFVAGDHFSAAGFCQSDLLHFGIEFGLVEKRPKFQAYAAPHIAGPAGRRAHAPVQELAVQSA